MNENPYAAPAGNTHPLDQLPEADQVRKSHLVAESNIRSIGIFCIPIGLLAFIGGVIISLQPNPDISNTAEGFGYYLGAIGLPLGILTLGAGLQNLNKTARVVAGILGVTGLVLFPVGTAICPLVLFILFSKKGRFVTTARYKEIIAKTPHIKRKTSIIAWALFAIIIIVFFDLIPLT